MSQLRKTEHGLIVIADPSSDRALLETKTVQCVHCGGHWIPRPGSGTVRGFCQRCAGPVCGPGCAACVPVEQYLENLEKGKPADFRPIVVPTSFE